MIQRTALLLICVIACVLFCNYTASTKTPINDCVKELFGDRANESEYSESLHAFRDPTRSYVEDLCSLMRGPRRYGCCKGMSVKYLYNVMLEDGNIVLFEGRKYNSSVSRALRMVTRLPYVQSVLKRKTHNFDWSIEHRKADFNRTKCKVFINGTLHVAGRLTTNNLFHAINDNVLPLVSQVVLDSYIDPEYNSLLRAQLIGFQADDDREAVRHMLLQKHFAPYMVPIEPFNFVQGRGRPPPGTGLCVRRIVWGTGFKLMYHHLLDKLRRESVALMRFATVKNPPALPEAYLKYQMRVSAQDTTLTPRNVSAEVQLLTERPAYPSLNAVTSINHHCKPLSYYTNSTKVNAAEGLLIKPCHDEVSLPVEGATLYRPLNIVIYTRGDSGNGRTLKGESLFVEKFLQLKAFATVCCNFKKTTLDEQLSYAVYADVVMGLHGAGLMNILFSGSYSAPGAAPVLIELKTQYGNQLDLFSVAADSIQGVHIQIDLSPYIREGGKGHHPVDDALVKRVVKSLQLALKTQRQQYQTHMSTATGVGEQCATAYCNGSVVQPNEKQQPLDVITYPPHYQTDFHYHQQHHILGPTTAQMASACRQLSTFQRYWQLIKADTSQYCVLSCPMPAMREGS